MNNAIPAVGPDSAINPEVVNHVKAVAASMIGHAALQRCDFDDIYQELFQQVIAATPKFDPSKSSFYTYACKIVNCHKKRIYRQRITSHLDIPSIPFEECSDKPSQFELDTAVNTVEQQCFINDVHTIVDRLPPKQKKFCTLILDGYSIRAAAKKCGTDSWGGRYRKSFINRIRKAFVKGGF